MRFRAVALELRPPFPLKNAFPWLKQNMARRLRSCFSNTLKIGQGVDQSKTRKPRCGKIYSNQVASSFDELWKERRNHMMELRKKVLTFLRDESGISWIEYAVLLVLIVLGIISVLSVLMRKGS
jgi:Flp pilus assembly pilin Flp